MGKNQVQNNDLELYQLKQFFLDIFFKEIWLIILLMLTSFAIGGYFVWKKPTNYRANGQVRIKNDFVGDRQLFPWIKGASDYDGAAFSSFMRDRGLFQKFVEEKKQQDKTFPYNQWDLIRGFRLLANTEEDLVSLVKDRQNTAESDEQVMSFTFDTSKKEQALVMIRSLLTLYFKEQNDSIKDEIVRKIEEYRKERESIQKRHDEVVAEMKLLRAKTNSLNIKEDMDAIVYLINTNLGIVESLQGKLELEQETLQSLTTQLNERLKEDVSLSLYDQSYADLKSKLVELEGERDLAIAAYDERHPKILSLDLRINRIKSELEASEEQFKNRSNRIATDPLANALHNQIQQTDRKLREILEEKINKEKLLKEQKKRYSNLANYKSKIDSLSELESVFSADIVSLNKFIELLNLNKGRDIITFSYEHELLDPVPFNNTFKEYGYALSLVLALLSTAGTLYTKYFFSGKFMRASEVPKLLPFQVVGLVTLDKRATDDNAFADPKSYVSECFRKLRANLGFLQSDARVFSITSSQKSDGKSFIAYNTALSLANMDKKVILIDGDFRLPRLHKILNLENLLGFVDLLDDCAFEDVLQETSLENLHFIASGIPSSASTDFLHGQRFEEVLAKLRDEYDYVVFDTPPLAFSTDPYLLIKKCDFTLFVLAIDRTKVVNAEKYLNELTKLGIDDIGLVVNRVAEVELFGQYSYRYYY